MFLFQSNDRGDWPALPVFGSPFILSEDEVGVGGLRINGGEGSGPSFSQADASANLSFTQFCNDLLRCISYALCHLFCLLYDLILTLLLD